MNDIVAVFMMIFSFCENDINPEFNKRQCVEHVAECTFRNPNVDYMEELEMCKDFWID